MAKAFHSLCYDVTVMADSDADDQFSQVNIEELTALGIQVQVWSEKLALEERAMLDLPWASVLASVMLARDEFNQSTYDQVCSKLAEVLDEDISKWEDSPALRKVLGEVAKKKAWFKNVTYGDLWFKAIAPAFDDPEFLKTDLAVKMNNLWAWVEHA